MEHFLNELTPLTRFAIAIGLGVTTCVLWPILTQRQARQVKADKARSAGDQNRMVRHPIP